ncbi:MAG: hypothetical protein IIB38_13290 [Candidatus Hydrogenedentes bacterium]|nr:hypothetical protein [Candidatus Hydrogenedentota bacterium]
MNEAQREQLKQLPQVQRLLESDRTAALTRRYSRDSVVNMLRQCLDDTRREITAGQLNGVSFSDSTFFDRVEEALKQDRAMSLRRVINATGIVLHTNLGRAPLADQAIQAIDNVARGYSNLELDLDSGKRGSRYRHIEEILCSLTASEAVMVVNNNAAAVMGGAVRGMAAAKRSSLGTLTRGTGLYSERVLVSEISTRSADPPQAVKARAHTIPIAIQRGVLIALRSGAAGPNSSPIW